MVYDPYKNLKSHGPMLFILHTLVQTIPDLIWLKDADGVYLLCNTMFERFFGALEADIVGKTDYDFVDRDLADFFREHDRKAMAAGKSSSNEEWVTFADDGHHALLETIKTPMYDADGTLVGVLGIAHDITERKQAEEALRESEERFRLVFDQSGEAIILALYETKTIIYANTTIEELLGYTREELFDNGLQLLCDHFEKNVLTNFFNEMPLQQDFLSTRLKATRKDGAGLVISIRIRIVKIGGNDLIYVSLRDMTEKVRLEEETRVAQAKLIHANKMSTLGTLVSGMAHEINNPNNFIMFNSDMLADIWKDADLILNNYFKQNGDFSLGGLPYPEVGEAAFKLIDGISEGSERIKIIVNDLRDFARQDIVETGRKMDINEAILKAAAILTPQIKKYTTKFQLNLQDNIPNNVGNVHKIEQVIINLLMNALQALPHKDCGVSISTAVKDENNLIVIIKDEGSGMTNETLARLSEPFFTTKSASSGTGLGLFISQSIVNAHKGSLRFESTPGAGTSVIIELPFGDNKRI